RIEIGLVTEGTLLEAIRAAAADEARLVVDAGAPEVPGSMSVSLDLAPGADADRLLEVVWSLGATDAFVLRD
ncbi:MAG: hypothetical protein H7Y08_08370, partial [Rhizobiaceae bacterium]|nr:hypothetical protein [Rhizobiaceae bacterium]